MTLMSLSELLQTSDVEPAPADDAGDGQPDQSPDAGPDEAGGRAGEYGAGAVVDEEALCEAADRGQLFGAALDVFKIEPLPTTSCHDNVVLCTHMGGMDHDSAIATSSLAAQCIVDLYNNRWPEACVVNRRSASGGSGEWGGRLAGPSLAFLGGQARRYPTTLKLKRCAAAAGLFGGRNVEVEAALLEAVDVVQRGAFQVQLALLVDHDLLAVEVELAVLGFVVVLVERQRIAMSAAAAAVIRTRRKLSGSA